MIREISRTSTITIPCRPEEALAAVWDIKNIEYTEVKADAVSVNQETATRGTYDVRGHFAGLPWHNTFAYELNARGFHSEEATPPASGTRISGGFIVEPLGERECKVIHYERYKLPRLLVPLKPLIELYLIWSMRKEMRDLKALITTGAASAPVR